MTEFFYFQHIQQAMDGGTDGSGRPDPGRKSARASKARKRQIGSFPAASHYVHQVHSDIPKIGGML